MSREIAEHIVRRAGSPAGSDIAEVIRAAGGLDITACEAAGLAHDLGHPPFGHAGEEALERELEPIIRDGFEGNPQSFRIVTTLERDKLDRTNGLDLTNVTLGAILKYPYVKRLPYEADENRKFGAFLSERDELARVRSSILGNELDTGQQTLEASIMDLADDVAYAVHDLEDFFAAGVLNPRNVTNRLNEAVDIVGDDRSFADSPSDDPFTVAAIKLKSKYEGYFDNNEYFAALTKVVTLMNSIRDQDEPLGLIHLRTELSSFVAGFFEHLQVSATPPYANGPKVFLSPAAWHEIQVLKVITRHFLVSTSRMGLLQKSQSKVIGTLVERLADWLTSKPKAHELPIPLLRIMAASNIKPGDAIGPEHYRAIADYICTMSDSEALMRAKWLTGSSLPGVSEMGVRY